MASYSGIKRSKHQTLVGGTQDDLTFDVESQQYEVVNLGTADIYVRFDKVTVVAAADETYIVRAKEAAVIDLDAPSKVVKLISSGAVEYHVTRIQGP